MLLSEIRQTTAFRAAVWFFCLFGVVSVVLFGYLYFQIVGFEQERTDEWLQREQASLLANPSNATAAHFAQQSQGDPLGQRPFALFGPDRQRLAGGFPDSALKIPYVDKPFSIRIEGLPKHPPARCIATALPGGQLAVQCQNTRGVDHFDEELLHALVMAATVTLLVGVAGAGFIGISAVRQMSDVTAAIKEIVGGNLSRRLPVQHRHNDVNRLAGVVNGMLDEIERLMTEVKSVCDAIAHDLRTPLTHVLGGLERVLRRTSSETELRVGIEEAISEMNGLLLNFNALLRISEIEGSSRRDNFATVDLVKIATDAVEFFIPSAEEKDINLEMAGASGDVLMEGDANLLFEAVTNLVENAVKFSPNGGAVLVEVFDDGKERGIRVSDNGPGIPVAEREAVFQRFFRGDASRNSPGHGLGLSLVMAIAQMHGMNVRIEDGPGARLVMSVATPPNAKNS